MQAMLRKHHQPLCSLETGKPLRDFDAIGITLQTELHYAGVVKVLDLTGIPRLAKDRSVNPLRLTVVHRQKAVSRGGLTAASWPLIIGGGPCSFHPEPVAPFFDAFCIGDGEEAVPELVDLMRKREFKLMRLQEKWEALAQIEGLYVPGLYRPDPDDTRRLIPESEVPRRIRARTLTSLKREFYPDRPIVPLVGAVHDRLTIELMRGCTQGCRFCQAGIINRPVRERPSAEIVEQIAEGLETTGWNEVGLLSLSTSDYSQLKPLLCALADKLSGRRASMAFPSLRPTSFTEDIASIQTGGKRSSLTFAVEAGSERLRAVINKSLAEEELFDAVDRAFQHSWSGIKLYFMVGLPTEREDDIADGAKLLERISRIIPRGKKLHISVAPFIPKPHSIFEGEAFADPEVLQHRQRQLYRRLKSRWIKTTWRDVNESIVETVLARGDRKMASVIAAVAGTGSGFEGWGGEFSADRWYEALDQFIPDWKRLLEPIGSDEPRPWNHLSKGITRRFMRNDLKSAFAEEIIPDCRLETCTKCGLTKICDVVENNLKKEVDKFNRLQIVENKLFNLSICKLANFYLYRLMFSKLLKARFLGHHDLMRAVERGLRRIGVPLFYSQGYNPRPKISYGPALPLGVGTVGAWVEFRTVEPIDESEMLKQAKRSFTAGIKPWCLTRIEGKRSRIQEEEISRRYRLRYNKPINIETSVMNVCKKDTLDIKEGIHPSSFILHPSKRTLYLTLKRNGKRFPNPENAAHELIEQHGGNECTPELVSITRMD